MNIKSHFNLGDKVFFIGTQCREVFVKCPCCDSGHVALGDGSKLKCPRCNGKGAIVDRNNHYSYVARKLTVGQIRFEIDAKQTVEQYMCEESGVGSGSLYYLKDLFPSQESAQAECDRRNNMPSVEWVCLKCRPEFDRFQYQCRNTDFRYCIVHEFSYRHLDIAEAEKLLAALKAKEAEEKDIA